VSGAGTNVSDGAAVVVAATGTGVDEALTGGGDEAAVCAATAGTSVDENETSTIGGDWTSAGPEAVFIALGGDDAAAGAATAGTGDDNGTSTGGDDDG